MRLLRLGPAGRERPCVLLPDGRTIDVSSLTGDYTGDFFAADGLARLRTALRDDAEFPVIDASAARVGACVARPPKIICVGLNYRDHAEEAGLPVPQEPVIFLKAPNTITGPYDDVRIPRGSVKTDWEVELAVVIGAEGRYLEDDEAALGIIAGYAVSHDVSEREFQLERGGQWVKGKSCETFNPLGPYLVTPDEIADVQALSLTLAVNGEKVQSGNTADMVFSVAHIVRYLSQFMVLEPGDVINTGTPAGVGMGQSPPRFLRVGDVTELDISGLGGQRQTFVASP